MRDGLKPTVPDYPELNYTHHVATLLQHLTDQHADGTIYIVTLGHVLAQAHDVNDVERFTRIIAHIVGMGASGRTALVAVDAKGWSGTFGAGWSAVHARLTAVGISQKPFSIRRTEINDENRAKIAILSRVAAQEGS